MKLYKLALQSYIAEFVKEKNNDRGSFVLGGKKRIKLDILNSSIQQIILNLENGNTTSQSVYEIDIEKGFAYKIINGEKENRPFRLGKVIQRELGENYLNLYSKYQNSIKNEDYVIIITRDPIDIARMSDHQDISSCHSPDGDYFEDAVKEAIEGALIAYVVKKQDYNKLIETYGEKSFEYDDIEIFNDYDRDFDEGIEPKARMKLNRYINIDTNEEFYAPIGKTYGKPIFGLEESLIAFTQNKLKEKYGEEWKEKIKNSLNEEVLSKTGGEYNDIPNDIVIKKLLQEDVDIFTRIGYVGSDVDLDFLKDYEEDDGYEDFLLKMKGIEERYVSLFLGNIVESSVESYENDFTYVISSELNLNYVFKGQLHLEKDELANAVRKIINDDEDLDINDFDFERYSSIVTVNIEPGEINIDIRIPFDSTDLDQYNDYLQQIDDYLENFEQDKNNVLAKLLEGNYIQNNFSLNLDTKNITNIIHKYNKIQINLNGVLFTKNEDIQFELVRQLSHSNEKIKYIIFYYLKEKYNNYLRLKYQQLNLIDNDKKPEIHDPIIQVVTDIKRAGTDIENQAKYNKWIVSYEIEIVIKNLVFSYDLEYIKNINYDVLKENIHKEILIYFEKELNKLI